MRRKLMLGFLCAILVVVLAACDTGDKSAQNSESNKQQKSYTNLVNSDPAHAMTYSPTRKTINAWIDTWNQPGQLSFTYIVNQNGEKVGYYVFLGSPVSMCAALTPTYKFVNPGGDHEDTLYQVPAPSLDGVYYSGGQCISYYGIDAITKQVIEFSIGGALNYISSTQPIYLNVPALGVTTIAQLKKDASGKYVLP